MSWMQRLCQTYDYAVSTGAAGDTQNPLPELGFIAENADLEIKLSADGRFVDANPVAKENARTVIPCTIESGVARQAPVKPHPIFDKVKNLSTPEQLQILKGWCDLGAPDSVKVVYSYLEESTLAGDLESCLSAKKCKYSDAQFVRFILEDGSGESSMLWLRESVRESWKQYFQSLIDAREAALCYATGETAAMARKHPNALGTTLLVSMSDENCVGRFEGCAAEAASVSIKSTMNAHNTFKWLCRRQGSDIFGMKLAAWDMSFALLPDVTRYDPYAEEDEPETDTGEGLGLAVKSGSAGYYSHNLEDYGKYFETNKSTAVIMAVDSATGNGRASLVYYQELEAREYIENLLSWYRSCQWQHSVRDVEGEWSVKPWTPLPRDICDLLYGKGAAQGQVKAKKQLMKELLPCITMRKRLPSTLVSAAFHKCVNPLSFRDTNSRWDGWAWRRAVDVTCALIRKTEYDKGDEHTMALDGNEKSRDKLFGSLLAVADTIENIALKQGESSRETNAMRYMQRFQLRPAETWQMLRTQKLRPYLNKLEPGRRKWYENHLVEIEASFKPGEIADNSPLSPGMLEGFAIEKTSRRNKEEQPETVENKEEN